MEKDTKTEDSIHSPEEANYLDKLISELQERNREKLKPVVTNNDWARKNKVFVNQIQKLFDALWVEQQKDLDQITTDTAHAVALAVIGEVRKITQKDRSISIYKRDLHDHLTTLEAKIKK